MAKTTKKLGYVEPVDYFPKDIRKKYKLGEYDDSQKSQKTQKKSTTPAKKKVKRK